MKIDPLGSPQTLPAPSGAQEAKAQAYLVTQPGPTGDQNFWSLEVSLVYAGAAADDEDATAKTAKVIEHLRQALTTLEAPEI